jgi:hypothetical protein
LLELEVKPHAPDSGSDPSRRDRAADHVALVGCEVNSNRDSPPRPLEEIAAEIRAIEPDIKRMLAEVMGSSGARREL